MFTALPKKTFLNNLDLAHYIKNDLEAAGMSVYRYERILEGGNTSASRAGHQLYTSRADIGLYINFRVSGHGQYSYYKTDPPANSYSEDIEYGIVAARPGDAEDYSSDFFYQSPVTTHNGEDSWSDSILSNGSLNAIFSNRELSSYQMWYSDTPTSYIVIIRLEWEIGFYNYLVFGKINKALAGSQFISSNLEPASDHYLNRKRLMSNSYPYEYVGPLFSGYNLFIRHDYMGASGWSFRPLDTHTTFDGGAFRIDYQKLIGSNYYEWGSPYYNTAGKTSGDNAFLPVAFFLEDTASGTQHLIGQLHGLYVINMDGHDKEITIHYGKDSYQLLTQCKLDYDRDYWHFNTGLVLKTWQASAVQKNDHIISDFSQEYFGKLLTDPQRVNLGVVVGETSESVNLFNTGDQPITISSTAIEGNSVGISVGGVPDGTLIDSFANRDMAIHITPSTLTEYRFKVSITANDDDVYQILGYGDNDYITGFLALEWDYQINYRNPVSESYRYKTDIIEAWDGSEQRISLLDSPDLYLYNNYTIDGQQWQDARSKIQGWQSQPFLVQNHNVHNVVDRINKGDTQIEIDSHRFSEGGFVTIKSGAGKESIGIAKRLEGAIELESPIKYDHVFPLVTYSNIFFMQPSIDIEHISPTAVNTQVEFVADESRYVINIEDKIDDFDVYKGSLVFDFVHNSSESEEESYVYGDVGLKAFPAVPQRSDRSRGFTRTLTFDLGSHKQIDRFKRFMHAVSGAGDDFWLADSSESVIIAREIEEASNQLVIKPINLEFLMSDYAKHVMIQSGGETYYREIANIIQGDNEEIIVLDTAIPAGAQANMSVKFFYKARFNTDTFDYEYYHDGYARITKTFAATRSMQ